MRAYVIHGAKDLRLADHETLSLSPDEVRLALAYGGICGSDLHYYLEGRVGNSVVRDPMVLGHELSGWVTEAGTNVKGINVGTAVAVNPALPCHNCRMCEQERYNLCFHMRYMGSAAFRPHTQGGFVEQPIVHQNQCVPLPEGADLKRAALAEPYSIALHAINRANVNNARVLITGAGTIGTLVAIAARHAGAALITVSDVDPEALRRVGTLTSAATLDATDDAAVQAFEQAMSCDVAIEASGAAAALNMALRALQPGGRLVQAGFLPQTGFDLNQLITKEISLLGTYRFLDEFDTAVAEVVADDIFCDVITATFPFGETNTAFDAAANKTDNLKVMLARES